MINEDDIKKYCRVCGFKHSDYPWGIDGASPSYEFCECCGVEFGYQDYTVKSTRQFRNQWLEKGLPWFNEKYQSEDWNFIKQAENIPEKFK